MIPGPPPIRSQSGLRLLLWTNALLFGVVPLLAMLGLTISFLGNAPQALGFGQSISGVASEVMLLISPMLFVIELIAIGFGPRWILAPAIACLLLLYATVRVWAGNPGQRTLLLGLVVLIELVNLGTLVLLQLLVEKPLGYDSLVPYILLGARLLAGIVLVGLTRWKLLGPAWQALR